MIVAYGGIIGLESKDELYFLPSDFRLAGCLRGPQYLAPDSEVLPLLVCEVAGDQGAAGAAKVVDAVGAILPDVSLTVWIGDLVNNDHWETRFRYVFGRPGAGAAASISAKKSSKPMSLSVIMAIIAGVVRNVL